MCVWVSTRTGSGSASSGNAVGRRKARTRCDAGGEVYHRTVVSRARSVLALCLQGSPIGG